MKSSNIDMLGMASTSHVVLIKYENRFRVIKQYYSSLNNCFEQFASSASSYCFGSSLAFFRLGDEREQIAFEEGGKQDPC